MVKIKEMEEKAGKNWIGEFKTIKTEEELKQKVSAYGIKLTEEEEKEALSLITKNDNNEITDEELGDIAGGARPLSK